MIFALRTWCPTLICRSNVNAWCTISTAAICAYPRTSYKYPIQFSVANSFPDSAWKWTSFYVFPPTSCSQARLWIGILSILSLRGLIAEVSKTQTWYPVSTDVISEFSAWARDKHTKYREHLGTNTDRTVIWPNMWSENTISLGICESEATLQYWRF